MYNRNFRSLALVSLVSALALTGCNSKPEVVGPDPALAGSASPSGNASPANQGSSTDPPPNSGKKKSAGTLQDKVCNSTLIKEGMAGLVRPFVKFTKDGKTLLVDPCLDGGATTVSFERFKTKSGREDFKVLSSDGCIDGDNCWYRIYSKGKKQFKTLAELKIAGSYKDGEATPEIPSDAVFVVGLYADSDGSPTQETNKVITKYVYQGSKPTDLGPVMARLDKLDQRMTDAEGKISGLVIAMAAYSQKTAMEEAM